LRLQLIEGAVVGPADQRRAGQLADDLVAALFLEELL